MYSMEFFNRCNITQPYYLVAQEHWQYSRGDIRMKKASISGVINAMPRDITGKSLCPMPTMNRLHFRPQSEALKGLLTSLGGCAVAAVVSVSAEEYPLQVGKGENTDSNIGSGDTSCDLYYGQPTEKSELEFIRESAMRSKLLEKLSEANWYGRHIRRQLLEKEDALLKCKSELALMETELQALIGLAEEAASKGAEPGTRKINGKYIQSHLLLRLEELHERLLLQVKDIDMVQYRDVPLVWYGMAENVQVMGSFDGWSQGEQMSPENTGAFTRFSATLKLRPGRYEIKFLVDGEWKLSPDWPTAGVEPTVNNVVDVE